MCQWTIMVAERVLMRRKKVYLSWKQAKVEPIISYVSHLSGFLRWRVVFNSHSSNAASLSYVSRSMVITYDLSSVKNAVGPSRCVISYLTYESCPKTPLIHFVSWRRRVADCSEHLNCFIIHNIIIFTQSVCLSLLQHFFMYRKFYLIRL